MQSSPKPKLRQRSCSQNNLSKSVSLLMKALSSVSFVLPCCSSLGYQWLYSLTADLFKALMVPIHFKGTHVRALGFSHCIVFFFAISAWATISYEWAKLRLIGSRLPVRGHSLIWLQDGYVPLNKVSFSRSWVLNRVYNQSYLASWTGCLFGPEVGSLW